ncbi:glycoside hydrolase family 97 protein [Sphingomonas sp.]|uniref:glycoside hydrolase family 97 protein n=1 Tax=Sphingomonas sp. TaxID=28214 RepID=UPI002DD6A9E3|nr:glycoside hydrolase family 97 protein [Sphingomonas sp.]
MRLLLALIALFAAQASHAETVATAQSPGKVIAVTVAIDADGRATYAVSRRGKPVLAPSALGFLFTDAAKIDRNLELADATTLASDTRWTQPWGEWTTIRDNHVELRVRLREKALLKREMTVVFRLFDDGIGFRYEVPKQPNLGEARIAEELTSFAFAGGATAWWIPAYEWNREEYLYRKTPLAEVGTAQTPITLKLADGMHVALHEAALVDYSGMNVTRVDGSTLRASLTPGSDAPKVVRTAPFATPWRTLVIADDAPGLYMSHITLNLNEPNRQGDVAWAKPGKFMGIWWNMIRGVWSWDLTDRHGASNANVRRYIDFAAANGIPNLLVEGWNVGWETNWARQYFTKPTADFDAPALAAYAKSKGVRLIGHHETGGGVSWYEDQMDAAFAYAASLGIGAVKTGYVADAGQIERVDADGRKRREWHEGQWMVNHSQRVVDTAAKYRIAIDAHEPVKDTGLRRTYPSLMTREGARGYEYMSWAVKNTPEHEANLVFTRMLAGPMDYTPGLFSLKGSNDSDVPATLAKQLANYVVIYSPLVMAADTPETYAKYPEAFRFIRDVPTDWSDTRVLAGEVGDHVTIVRKDRASDDWYLGAVGDEQARTTGITLDFLDAGRTYTAQIYRDGPDADYRTAGRHSIAIEEQRVGRGDRLTIALAPGGGQAIRFAASARRR